MSDLVTEEGDLGRSRVHLECAIFEVPLRYSQDVVDEAFGYRNPELCELLALRWYQR